MISVKVLGQFPKYIAKSENSHLFNSQSVRKSLKGNIRGLSVEGGGTCRTAQAALTSS